MSEQQAQPREHAEYVRTERSHEEVVLAVDGPLYDEFADEFQLQLDALAAGGWPIVTLDFTKVKVIASKATGTTVLIMKRLKETRRTLRIRGCDPGLYRQFTSIRFDRIIDIQP